MQILETEALNKFLLGSTNSVFTTSIPIAVNDLALAAAVQALKFLDEYPFPSPTKCDLHVFHRGTIDRIS